MSPSLSIAANLSPDIRQRLAIEVLSKSKPVSHLAAEHQVSRKFVYRQVNKAAVLSEGDPMFVSHSPRTLGQRLGYQGIYYMVKDLAKAAGLENVHPHSGRHTFASRLLENGMDAFLAMKLTRHRSIQAFKVYTHEVQYQAAKADYCRGQGEEGRSVMSLEEILKMG
jgi:site-specific recombinase XerD